MCLGIPGQVVELVEGYGGQLALVDVTGARRKVNIGMLDGEPPGAGEWVLIHMGFAVERVTATEAEEALQGLELMGRPRSADPAAAEPWAADPAGADPGGLP
jgi:hydrogenase assembly chaperone HypC/HupF